MLTFALLSHAANLYPSQDTGHLAALLAMAHQREIEWALQAGLGPFLHELTAYTIDPITAARVGTELRRAELTSHVTFGANLDTALEIIAECHRLGVPVTLLKGISISDQYYPKPHFRPMTDVDLLVPSDTLNDVEAAALRLGYVQRRSIMGPDPHHGEPLYHPVRRTKLEIHTALFPRGSPPSSGELFSTANVTRQSNSTDFHGFRVRRLSPELQLVYIATYLAHDLTLNSFHPSFVTPLMDVAWLLRATGSAINWESLVSMIDNEFAAASLSVVLAYLIRRDVVRVPDTLVRDLEARQQLLSPVDRSVLELTVHRYIVGGRNFSVFHSWHIWRNLLAAGRPTWKTFALPWNVVFPPSYPDRFAPERQLRRLARWFKRHR